MPIPGSGNAPRKFKGHCADVEIFLNHYEKLLAANTVSDEKEKREAIRQH